jgi:hypothetical protein
MHGKIKPDDANIEKKKKKKKKKKKNSRSTYIFCLPQQVPEKSSQEKQGAQQTGS